MRAAAIVLALAALLALLAAACKSGDGGDGGPSGNVTPAATGSNHVLGSPEAPVEIIEYADFQ
ncbi:MAG TPA: hypothetical protein VJN32_06090 [Dehalococcoidia bacterium]|nr:hypothetical protein [Dehalococcoidia bacterium]